MAAMTSSSLSAALSPSRLSSKPHLQISVPSPSPSLVLRKSDLKAMAMAAPMIEGTLAPLAPFEEGTAAPLEVEEPAVPTPVLPSGAMMAEFLTHYIQMLEHTPLTGDSAADDIHFVLERIRVGTEGLLHHPRHGASPLAGEGWRQAELRLEKCIAELEKDEGMMRAYHERYPHRLAVKLVEEHCTDAARILTKL